MRRLLSLTAVGICIIGAVLIFGLLAYIGLVLVTGGGRMSITEGARESPQVAMVSATFVIVGTVPMILSLDLARHVWKSPPFPDRLINLVWFMSITFMVGLIITALFIAHPDTISALIFAPPFVLYAIGVIGAYLLRPAKEAI